MNNDQKGKTSENGARIRIVRFVYGLLAAGILVCIILQVFFAGLGVLVNAQDLQLHRVFANYFEWVPIILFLLSFAGRIRGTLRWSTLALFAIMSLQHITVQVFSGQLRAIHTIDALLLFSISLYLMKRSWSWVLLRTDTAVAMEEAQI